MYASFLAEILLKSEHSNQSCLLGSPSLGFFQQAGPFVGQAAIGRLLPRVTQEPLLHNP
jgi:hypothetical protein